MKKRGRRLNGIVRTVLAFAERLIQEVTAERDRLLQEKAESAARVRRILWMIPEMRHLAGPEVPVEIQVDALARLYWDTQRKYVGLLKAQSPTAKTNTEDAHPVTGEASGKEE